MFLCNSDFKILDRISRTSNNLVGDSYRLPDSYRLLNPNNIEDKDLFDVFSAPKNEWINKIGYLSPFMTKEIIFRTAIIGDSIENRIKIFKEIIKENSNLDIFLYKVNGKVQTISSYKLNHIIDSDTEKIEELNFKTVNEAMNYVEDNLTPKRLEQEKTRVISQLNKSLKLKKQLLKEQLELKKQYEDSDKYQNIGNLITANLYRLKSGDKLLEAEDWVTNKIVKIELDPSKTPSANAKKYFNLYKKSKRGIIEVDKRISSLNSDIKWFEEQIWLAENAEIETWLQIDENTKTNRFNKNKENSKKNQSSKNIKIQIKAYLEENNCKYYVGHNAKQNDQITFKLGKKGDIWFHANDVPGAHILLKKIEGDITKENILTGARLAALNSYAKNSSKVAVDYTDVSNVKRIPNGGLGQVSYTNQHTILVNLTPIDTSNKT